MSKSYSLSQGKSLAVDLGETFMYRKISVIVLDASVDELCLIKKEFHSFLPIEFSCIIERGVQKITQTPTLF